MLIRRGWKDKGGAAGEFDHNPEGVDDDVTPQTVVEVSEGREGALPKR